MLLQATFYKADGFDRLDETINPQGCVRETLDTAGSIAGKFQSRLKKAQLEVIAWRRLALVKDMHVRCMISSVVQQLCLEC